jgi:hypothetical protein
MKQAAGLAFVAVTVLGTVGGSGIAQASVYADAPPAVAAQATSLTSDQVIQGCIVAAARRHSLPPAIIVVLLNVEGGTIGHVSQNSNDTVDIGPMQVNEIWLPQLARHWNASINDTFEALRDNFCANVEGGSWILREALDESEGDFWKGVGIYHSHDPDYQHSYLGAVLHEVLRLKSEVSTSVERPTQLAGR